VNPGAGSREPGEWPPLLRDLGRRVANAVNPLRGTPAARAKRGHGAGGDATVEIDLVALDGDTLVFVEVKARSAAGFGGPEGAVTASKRVRIARAAAFYLSRRGFSGRPVRFDVLSALPEGPGGRLAFRLLPDAFRSPLRFTL